MDHKLEFKRLDLHSLKAGLASLALLVFGIVALLLYLNPTLVGISPGAAREYRDNLLWLLTAVLFLTLGLMFFIIVRRWPRRLKWIVQSQTPRPMRLQLEVIHDSGSSSYHALLHSPNEISARLGWRAAIWLMPASAKTGIDGQFDSQVYFDPKTGKPAVIEYEHGLLWIMAGSSSVQKLA